MAFSSHILLGFLALGASISLFAQPSTPSAILVELFTSEGCSSCPPADELLRQVSGQKTAGGRLIVGISEHVTYWNGLGWKDPYSTEESTDRQHGYSDHFGLDSVYTPQMVVNGREQFVGSDRRALESALAAEAKRKPIDLRITAAGIKDNSLTFSYTAAGLSAKGSCKLVAVVVDDMDRSSVRRGENSGRDLTHIFVARALVSLGAVHENEAKEVRLPLPPSMLANAAGGHHLVLFAQETGFGAVVGTDSKPI